MNKNIKTDISGKWVPIGEVQAIIKECMLIAQSQSASAVVELIKQKFGVDHE